LLDNPISAMAASERENIRGAVRDIHSASNVRLVAATIACSSVIAPPFHPRRREGCLLQVNLGSPKRLFVVFAIGRKRGSAN
jgi:hypothetical protein